MPLLNEKFFKASEATEGDLIKIVDEGSWVTSTKFKNQDDTFKQQFNITVKVGDGTERTLSMNAMSRNNLKAKWGRDTSLWVGKTAQVHFEKGLVGGKMQDILILQPLD